MVMKQQQRQSESCYYDLRPVGLGFALCIFFFSVWAQRALGTKRWEWNGDLIKNKVKGSKGILRGADLITLIHGTVLQVFYFRKKELSLAHAVLTRGLSVEPTSSDPCSIINTLKQSQNKTIYSTFGFLTAQAGDFSPSHGFGFGGT